MVQKGLDGVMNSREEPPSSKFWDEMGLRNRATGVGLAAG